MPFVWAVSVMLITPTYGYRLMPWHKYYVWYWTSDSRTAVWPKFRRVRHEPLPGIQRHELHPNQASFKQPSSIGPVLWSILALLPPRKSLSKPSPLMCRCLSRRHAARWGWASGITSVPCATNRRLPNAIRRYSAAPRLTMTSRPFTAAFMPLQIEKIAEYSALIPGALEADRGTAC